MNHLFCGSILFMAAALLAEGFTDQTVTYKSVRVDNLDIFYREAGPKDGPVVLFLHGFPSSSRMYQELLTSSLSSKYRLIAPDYPGFGHSSWPEPKAFAYTFEHIAEVMQDFADRLELRHYTVFMQDYGVPIGFRMSCAHPARVSAMIVQNGVINEEGLSELWGVRRAFWADRAAHEAALRPNFVSLEATRQRHVGSTPNPESINPDAWVDEYYFLNRPGQADIQVDLFFDYQNNVRSYPIWQQWLRDHQPPMLVVWGRFDPSFTVAGAEAYQKCNPKAEIHLLAAGHFAMDQKSDEIIRLTERFLDRQQGGNPASSRSER